MSYNTRCQVIDDANKSIVGLKEAIGPDPVGMLRIVIETFDNLSAAIHAIHDDLNNIEGLD